MDLSGSSCEVLLTPNLLVLVNGRVGRTGEGFLSRTKSWLRMFLLTDEILSLPVYPIKGLTKGL